MDLHYRATIRQRAASALQGIGATVKPGRVEAVDVQQCPLVCAYCRDEGIVPTDGTFGGAQLRAATLVFDIFATRNNTVDDVVDQLSLSIERRIADCARLDGAVEDIEILGTEIDVGEAENKVGLSRLSYAVTYRTDPKNPTAI